MRSSARSLKHFGFGATTQEELVRYTIAVFDRERQSPAILRSNREKKDEHFLIPAKKFAFHRQRCATSALA